MARTLGMTPCMMMSTTADTGHAKPEAEKRDKVMVALCAFVAVLGASVLLVMRWWRKRNAIARRVLRPDAEDPERLGAMTDAIVDEVVSAMGFPLDSWQRRLLGPLLELPGRTFARVAVSFDLMVARDGIGRAFGDLMALCVTGVEVRGADMIPAEGPLLIVSNHPGAYDVPLIVSVLPRHDLHLVASTVPFLQELPHLLGHLIEVTREPKDGMRGVRQAIRHLRKGGALLILPSGIVDPDPDVLPGAHEALETWSPSIELLLRRAPETQVLVVIVSGVLSPAWLRTPIVRVQKEIWRQRKLAEMFQIMQQVLFPTSLMLTPRVSLAPPLSVSELDALYDGGSLHEKVIHRARELLAEHMSSGALGDWQ